jgi:hypothetical protein
MSGNHTRSAGFVRTQQVSRSIHELAGLSSNDLAGLPRPGEPRDCARALCTRTITSAEHRLPSKHNLGADGNAAIPITYLSMSLAT